MMMSARYLDIEAIKKKQVMIRKGLKHFGHFPCFDEIISLVPKFYIVSYSYYGLGN
jgi:hypothetical protein